MRYRTALLAALGLCIISATARAQDVATAQTPPRVEVFVGIGPVFHSNGHGPTGTDSGWAAVFDAGLAVNLNSRTSIVLDNVSFGKSNDAWSYGFMVGPRIRFGGNRRLTGFSQVLIGMYRWNPGAWAANTGGTVALSDRSTALQGAAAAGLDLRSRSVSRGESSRSNSAGGSATTTGTSRRYRRASCSVWAAADAPHDPSAAPLKRGPGPLFCVTDCTENFFAPAGLATRARIVVLASVL
jgi:hypothetical protein